MLFDHVLLNCMCIWFAGAIMFVQPCDGVTMRSLLGFVSVSDLLVTVWIHCCLFVMGPVEHVCLTFVHGQRFHCFGKFV